MHVPGPQLRADAHRGLAVGLTPLETRREVVLHLATRAEQLAYYAFYLAEGWGHDAAVLLTEVAVLTSRIRLGTGVLNIWGRSPATIAMLATSLHQVSAGRFVLGLGAGSPQLAEGLHDVRSAQVVAWRSRCVVPRWSQEPHRLSPPEYGEASVRATAPARASTRGPTARSWVRSSTILLVTAGLLVVVAGSSSSAPPGDRPDHPVGAKPTHSPEGRSPVGFRLFTRPWATR